MKKILPLIALVAIPFFSQAQIDTEFWFGAPDLTMGASSEARRDSTVYIVVAALNQPSQVRISLPANLDFEPIVVNLAANTLQEVNLGNFLSLIETKPADSIVNTGILVRATKPITAYYEIRSPNNTDIFSLKGKNAVGKKFYTPFQTEFQNNQFLNSGNFYNPGPRSGFIVMATKDQTTITITPTKDIVGHLANESFSILLDRGQTYYAESIDGTPENHPGGSLIESDKDITVTVKDDMIDVEPSNPGGADVIGDQLIAFQFLGTDHIFVKGEVDVDSDRIVIVGTVDNTELYIDGSTTPVLIGEGEQHIYSFTEASSFLSASENVVAFQVTGLSDQIAGAAVPSLNCTGSQQIGFVRGGLRPFFLTITIKAGSEGGFMLNGSSTLVPASAFQPVVGTNGEYVYARIQFSTSVIPVGQPNILTNFGTELFHLATSNGNSASVNFGYFSAFSYLNIGNNAEVCLNDSLELDAGPGKTSYLWNTGDTTQSITIYEAGDYIVEVFSGSGCTATDTISVLYYEPPIDLGPNDTICDGTTLNLEVEGNYLFEWQDGSTENTYSISDPGLYYVTVTDFQDCQFRDSITVNVSPRPETPDISGVLQYCAGETISLTMDDYDNANYRYILPNGITVSTQNLNIENASPSDSGTYYGYYVVEGCETFNDSVTVVVNPSPALDLGEDISVCTGESVEIFTNAGDVDYLWQDGTTTSTYVPTVSGQYYLTVTDDNNCMSSDTINVDYRPLPDNPEINGDNNYCEGETISLSTAPQEGAIYTWVDGAGNALPDATEISLANANPSQSGTFTVSVELDGCFSDTTATEVTVNPNPVFTLDADTALCNGQTVTIAGPDGFASYEWSNGDSTQNVTVGSGNYTLVATDGQGCVASSEVMISESGPTAAFTVLPDTVVNPETSLSFVDNSQAGLNPLTSWFWEFGNGGTSDQQNPGYEYGTSGVFNVTLVVTDAVGCQSTASTHVISNFSFKIPEGFSPNNDGVNDKFEILGLEGLSGTKMQIFDRWGGIVFESDDYQPGNFWDGDNNTDGTYFYVIKLPNNEILNGPVTIAR